MKKQTDLTKITNAFAGNLREYRMALGLTQEQLAEVSGLSSNYIARLETGVNTPSFSTLIKLSKALNVKTSDLLETEFTPSAPSDISETIAMLLSPLNDPEREYVLSQLRNSVRFVIEHRKTP